MMMLHRFPDRGHAQHGWLDSRPSFSLADDHDSARLACVHGARGQSEINGQRLDAGAAARLDGETRLQLRSGRGLEALAFDLAR